MNAVLTVVPYSFLRLGHFYFTKLLLPTLLATAKTSSDGRVRIVNTSSLAHELCSGLDFNTFKEGPARTKKGTRFLYTQSKLVRFLSPTFHQYSCNHREISKYQKNLPIDMETMASFLHLSTPEILKQTLHEISPCFSISCL